MLHTTYSYAGLDTSEHVIVADQVEYSKIQQYAKNLQGQSYLLDLKRCPDAVKNARCLTIRGKTIEALPSWISACNELQYLSIPQHLGQCLDSVTLCPRLITIEFTGEGKTNLGTFEHKKIQRIVSPEAVVIFEVSGFPELMHFHAASDKRQTMLKKLSAAGVQLISATLSPFASTKDLCLLNCNGLKYLRLVSGNVESLEGLDKFGDLADLHLHDLTKIESLEPLFQLQLQELSVGYCTKVRDFEKIVNMKSLQRLSIYGCGAVVSEELKRLLVSMKLEKLLV